MKTKNLLAYLFAALFSAPLVASAQDSTKTFTISGSIDTYAHSSLGTRYAGAGGFTQYAPLTSFSNLRGFGLGMFNLIASYQGEKAGFVADVVFGPRGYDAVFGNQYTGQRIVNQLFGYVKLSDVVTVNLGQFNTFLGYEVISPTLNFNYSTSYLFSYGPFNHTGVRVDFATEGGFVAKIALMNPTDLVEFNPVNTYTLGGQVGFTNDAGGIWLNALYGDQDGTLDGDLDPVGASSRGTTFQVDLTTGWTLGESFYLGLNTSMQSTAGGQEVNFSGNVVDIAGVDPSSFFGVAIYPKFIASDALSVGLRGEYFSIKNSHVSPIGLDTNGDGNVIAGTLSANYKIGGLTLIPELRVDITSEDTYREKDGTPTDMIPSLTLAAVYKF